MAVSIPRLPKHLQIRTQLGNRVVYIGGGVNRPPPLPLSIARFCFGFASLVKGKGHNWRLYDKSTMFSTVGIADILFTIEIKRAIVGSSRFDFLFWIVLSVSNIRLAVQERR